MTRDDDTRAGPDRVSDGRARSHAPSARPPLAMSGRAKNRASGHRTARGAPRLCSEPVVTPRSHRLCLSSIGDAPESNDLGDHPVRVSGGPWGRHQRRGPGHSSLPVLAAFTAPGVFLDWRRGLLDDAPMNGVLAASRAPPSNQRCGHSPMLTLTKVLRNGLPERGHRAPATGALLVRMSSEPSRSATRHGLQPPTFWVGRQGSSPVILRLSRPSARPRGWRERENRPRPDSGGGSVRAVQTNIGPPAGCRAMLSDPSARGSLTAAHHRPRRHACRGRCCR